MTEQEVLTKLRAWLRSPQGQHDDPYFPVKWGDDGRPRINPALVTPVEVTDAFVLALFDEAVRRQIPRPWDADGGKRK